MVEASFEDEYPAVGIPRMDEDHAKIAMALRQLIEAVRSDDTTAAKVLARALIERTIEHFFLEKGLMEEISFEFIERHRLAHQDFLTEAQRALEELTERGLTVDCLRWTSETMAWFRNHVRTEDLALARALMLRYGHVAQLPKS